MGGRCVTTEGDGERDLARAIYRGLHRWFPELTPLFRQYYARAGRLYTVGKEGRRLVVDEHGEPYWSAEGCTQGDPLGPFWFAVGYTTPRCSRSKRATRA